jgi:hypothetical protein
MNTVYQKYEHLRNLCAKCHEEEYAEYLHEYPLNPFGNEPMKIELKHISIGIIDEAIRTGSCDDLFEALYFVPKLGGCLYGD